MTVMNEYMKQIGECMKEKRKLTDSSVNQYMATLIKLNGGKPFINLAWTKKYEDVQKIIDTYAPSTKLTQYAVLVSALSCFATKPTYRGAYNYWRSKMLATVEDKRKQPIHEKSEKQEENMLPWDDIKKKASSLKEAISSYPLTKHTLTVAEYNNVMDYVILCLYTEIQPRRNKDYNEMCFIKSGGKSADASKNYYDLSNDMMYFNCYKTAKKYGQQEAKATPEIRQAVDMLLKIHPLAKGRWKEIKMLVKHDGTPLEQVNTITRRLNKIFGKKIGSSMLRHIFLTDKYGNSVKEREVDAVAMGHSVAQANEYIKFDSPKAPPKS
jgi:integrase